MHYRTVALIALSILVSLQTAFAAPPDAALALAAVTVAEPIRTDYLQGVTRDPGGGTLRSRGDPHHFGDWTLSVEVTDGRTGQEIGRAHV